MILINTTAQLPSAFVQPALLTFHSHQTFIASSRLRRISLATPRRVSPLKKKLFACDVSDFVPIPPVPSSSFPLDASLQDANTPHHVKHNYPLISPSRIAAALWKFSRPHTVYGTIISVSSLTTVARQLSCAVTWLPALYSFLTALLPSILINVYIVGLNQLYDVDIDRVNKPFLPLPAGLMTRSDAIFVIIASLLSGLAFCLSPIATPSLRIVLLGSTLLGTLYSMPPFRLKRFALLASIAILTVRGVLVNVGFFLHGIAAGAAEPAAVLFRLPPLVVFATTFFMLFGIVIALLKDAPDIRGDRMFGIRTFSVRLGAPAVFTACSAILVAMFSVAAAFYFFAARTLVGGVIAGITHLSVAAMLIKRARAVNANDSRDISQFYMFSWKAFYLEYMLLPIAAL